MECLGQVKKCTRRAPHRSLEISPTVQLNHEADELVHCPRDQLGRDETV